MAFAYWQAALAVIDDLNSGREKTWERVQGTLRGFSSGDDGIQESAELRLGFRLPPSVEPEALAESLAAAGGDQAAIRFSGLERAIRAEKNTPLVRAFLAAVRREGGNPSFVYKTGTSDMNVVGHAWQCPILAYGPGDSSLDHTPHEHVELAEWRQSVAVLADAINQLTSPAT
jgi:LysW-gamma-L-lysine carboxypeptidase